MTFRSRLWALAVLSAFLSTQVAGAQQSDEVVFLDEPDAPQVGFFGESTGMAADGDELVLVSDGRLPAITSQAYSGTHSAQLQYRHTAEGSWELVIRGSTGQPVDLTGFDSLVVYLNGPESLDGNELPRIGLIDQSGLASDARWLSTPTNVAIHESSGFTQESPTNLTLSARYVGPSGADARRPGYPENLIVTFADEPVDTSIAGIGAPAVPARFAITTASGQKVDFRFRDVVADGVPTSDGEYVEVLLPEADDPTRRSAVWRLEPDPITGEFVPPGSGDVYRLNLTYDALHLDADPATWQRVSIPISRLDRPATFAMDAVQGVLFRHGGENPSLRTVWIDRLFAVKNDDEAFLEMVQRATFDFFWNEANRSNGLVKDRSTPNSASSIAAVGFALSTYTVAIERGWITREMGRERVLTTLRFFWNAPQSTATDATGYKGFFYHFLNMSTGRRAGTNELSTVDTALLLGGVLHMRTYFTEDHPDEAEIRDLADAIYERVDWQWAQARPPLISHGWYPDPAGRTNADPNTGFIVHDWNGYNEAMILYILALGSPTYPVGTQAWDAWVNGYSGQWQTHYGYSFLTFPPLFGHQYSHVWIDFRGIQDAYMRDRGIDYFENSRRATLAQRAYHIHNPRGWPNYGPDEWGLTASDTPTGYSARGAPPAQNDDGTLVPTAPGGSVPFAPDETIAALRHMYETHGDRLWGPYGFRDAYNISANWFDPVYLGIDQGPILLMIENYRTEQIWSDFMQHPAVIRGLLRAGFEGEPLSRVPDEAPRSSLILDLYPNPAPHALQIRYELDAPGEVRIEVFDVLGRRVGIVANAVSTAGRHEFTWTTTDLAPGVYFVRATDMNRTHTKSFIHLR